MVAVAFIHPEVQIGRDARTDHATGEGAQQEKRIPWLFNVFHGGLSYFVFSRMRSEGFLFLSGGSGGGTVFVPISGLFPRAFASVRERSRAFASVRARTFVLCPMRCALRIGLPGGRLGEALWRCAVVIGGESLVWVAPCRCDCWGEPGLGGAVPWGLVGRAWSGRRCAVVIGGESWVWGALCRCDWWGEPGLGGAVPL